MAYQIVSYIDIVSTALLAILDNEETTLNELQTGYEIVIDKDFKPILSYHIKNLCKGQYHYGIKNLLIDSCLPSSNWRQVERGSYVKSTKHILKDDSVFILDLHKFNKIATQIFKKQKQELPEFYYLSNDKIDFYDIVEIVNQLCENVVVIPQFYHILIDANIGYNHTAKPPAYISLEIENMLRKLKLVN